MQCSLPGVLLIILLAFARYLVQESQLLRSPPPPDIEHLCRANAEAMLACGLKLPLAEASLYELELIPGLGATLAERIYLSRARIIATASSYPQKDHHHALEIVHGIGPKSAQALQEYLDLSAPAAPLEKTRAGSPSSKTVAQEHPCNTLREARITIDS